VARRAHSRFLMASLATAGCILFIKLFPSKPC
jgi:hypothetical protein